MTILIRLSHSIHLLYASSTMFSGVHTRLTFSLIFIPYQVFPAIIRSPLVLAVSNSSTCRFQRNNPNARHRSGAMKNMDLEPINKAWMRFSVVIPIRSVRLEWPCWQLCQKHISEDQASLHHGKIRIPEGG